MNRDENSLSDVPREPDDRVPDSEVDADEMLGTNPEDEVIPASPGRRRRAILIALLFLAAMILFWVLFIATHTGTREADGLLGSITPAGRAGWELAQGEESPT